MSKRVSRPLILMTAMSGCQNFYHTIIYKDPTSMANEKQVCHGPFLWFHVFYPCCVHSYCPHICLEQQPIQLYG